MDAAHVCEVGSRVTPVCDAVGRSSGVRLLAAAIGLALRDCRLVFRARRPRRREVSAVNLLHGRLSWELLADSGTSLLSGVEPSSAHGGTVSSLWSMPTH